MHEYLRQEGESGVRRTTSTGQTISDTFAAALFIGGDKTSASAGTISPNEIGCVDIDRLDQRR
jgi:hypothetical protein